MEEDIAAADPTAIIRTPVDIIEGIKPEAAEKMAIQMGFGGAQAKEAATLMANLYKAAEVKKSFIKSYL